MSKRNDNILSSPIEYLKGVGPQRAELLKKELGIFTFRDLLEHFPFRHIDKTIITPISEIGPNTEWVQVSGKLLSVGVVGDKRSKRLVAEISDSTGRLELVWFQGVSWIQKSLVTGQKYLVYGRVSYFNGQVQLSHPEMDPVVSDVKDTRNFLEPV
jgi:ATP-dependent DNA helicase RecG